MEPEQIHDLTPAYALGALDGDETEAYESHLRRCATCRDELAQLREAAASLAYAAPPARPPDALRSRIVERARAERANVIPFRRLLRDRRVSFLAAGAAAAAAATVALAIWAAILHSDLGGERSAHSRDAEALAVIAARGTRTVALQGSPGMLAVAPSGQAALVVSGLPAARAGHTYEAWVIRGSRAQPAGLFRGGSESVVALTSPVPRGAAVGVTVERAGGASRPSSSPIISAQFS